MSALPHPRDLSDGRVGQIHFPSANPFEIHHVLRKLHLAESQERFGWLLTPEIPAGERMRSGERRSLNEPSERQAGFRAAKNVGAHVGGSWQARKRVFEDATDFFREHLLREAPGLPGAVST